MVCIGCSRAEADCTLQNTLRRYVLVLLDMGDHTPFHVSHGNDVVNDNQSEVRNSKMFDNTGV